MDRYGFALEDDHPIWGFEQKPLLCDSMVSIDANYVGPLTTAISYERNSNSFWEILEKEDCFYR